MTLLLENINQHENMTMIKREQIAQRQHVALQKMTNNTRIITMYFQGFTRLAQTFGFR